MLETLVDYNERNNAPFSNENILQEISKGIAKQETEKRDIILDAHNITMDILCQSPVRNNRQGENANAIITSERINKLDALEEPLKGLTINDAVYSN